MKIYDTNNLDILNFNFLGVVQQKQMKMCKACRYAQTHTHRHTHIQITHTTHTLKYSLIEYKF